MKHTVILLLAAAWLLAGCGAGENKGEARSDKGRESVAGDPGSRAPGEARTDGGESSAGTAEEPAGVDAGARAEESPSLDAPTRDEALAESRRQSQQRPRPEVAPTDDLVPAPAWELKDLDGNLVSSEDFAGKVVILNFWATWCGPCRYEIPSFIHLYDKYRDDLVIVGIALDREGKRKVAPFVEQLKINYPIVLGNAKVTADYGPIRAIPVTYVLTRKGKIYKKYVGARPRNVFEADIKNLLGI